MGITPYTGSTESGTFYEINADGSNYNVVYDFYRFHGKEPMADQRKLSDRCSPGSGKWETVRDNQKGGDHDKGVLYQYDPTNSIFAVLKHFHVANLCAEPLKGPMQAANGKIYGACLKGGSQNKGTLYEYDLNLGSLTILHEFNGSDGKFPMCRILQHINGYFYGITSGGGNADRGTLFRFNPMTNELTN